MILPNSKSYSEGFAGLVVTAEFNIIISCMILPIPSPRAQIQSDTLSAVIRQEIIQSGGLITFARFMELALYTPGLGYYSAEHPKLGKSGDFITAPEISPLFSQCVAQQCKQILCELGKGDILEIGAGTGLFAKDLLLELEELGQLPEHYFIFEISEDLQARQKKLLTTHCSHLLPRIIWLDSLSKTITGVVIANEVLDALPVHCFRINYSGIHERCVTWKKDHFDWLITTPTSSTLAQSVGRLCQEYALPDGYASEINLSLPTWIDSLASALKQGVILLFDYGYGRAEYYHAERNMGTLMCYYQHHRHDNPFKLIGLQDITAHVDFTSIIEAAAIKDYALAGYTTQATFLLNCRLLELAQKKATSSIAQFNQAHAIKKLTLPSEMGELIKVMALSKNYTKPLGGFPKPDRRRDL